MVTPRFGFERSGSIEAPRTRMSALPVLTGQVRSFKLIVKFAPNRSQRGSAWVLVIICRLS